MFVRMGLQAGNNLFIITTWALVENVRFIVDFLTIISFFLLILKMLFDVE
jgi:hypothetical protein